MAYYRADGVRITHDPYARGMAEKYGAPGKTDADGNKKATPGINISSHFPRFQEVYTLGVTPVPGSALALHKCPRFRPDVSGGNTAAHRPGRA